MSPSFTPSPALVAAVRTLRGLPLGDGVPLPAPGYRGLDGVSDEERRLLWVFARVPATASPAPDAAPVAPPAVSVPSPLPVRPRSLALANARVGEPYQAAVAVEGLGPLVLVDGGGSVLVLSSDGSLSGTPDLDGALLVDVDAEDAGGPVEIRAALSAIPDPRSLWTSRDSDSEDPYWKPDAASHLLDAGLRCLAASKRGRAHARVGSFRDDDFALAHDPASGWHVAVVADGAGSAPLARLGSRVAVEHVAEHLIPVLAAVDLADFPGSGDAGAARDDLMRDGLVQVAGEAAAMPAREAAAAGVREADLATTLVIVAIRPLGPDWLVVSFAVGDGAAVLLDRETGAMVPLMTPDNGAFAGQTRFLETALFADREAMRARTTLVRPPRFTAALLMTDGVSDAKFPTDAVLADPAAWAAFWDQDLTAAVDVAGPAGAVESQLLDWLDFWSRGNHDDRTLALLVPRAPAP